MESYWRAAAEDDGLQRMCKLCHNRLRMSAKKPRPSEPRSSGKRMRLTVAAAERGGPSPSKPAKAAHLTGDATEAGMLRAAPSARTEALSAATAAAAPPSGPVVTKTCSGCAEGSRSYVGTQAGVGSVGHCYACLQLRYHSCRLGSRSSHSARSMRHEAVQSLTALLWLYLGQMDGTTACRLNPTCMS